MTQTVSLERLGLSDGASDADVEEAHAELVAYLELAPTALKSWAADELAAADQAYAELLAHAPQQVAQSTGAPADGRAARKVRSKISDFDTLTDGGDLFDGRVESAPARVGRKSTPKVASDKPSRLTPGLRRLAIVAGAVAALAVVAFAGYQLGNPSVPGINGTPAPTASGVALDPNEIAALMQKISVNPQDVDSLSQLADLYYSAGDYETAGTWLDKIIAINPKDVAALLGRGAVAFNTGDDATAESSWRAVIAIDDKNVEAHYDLGFMYFTADPPKSDQARAEWNRVVELVPDSDIAQTVKTHLGQLDAAASPDGTTTSSPAAGAEASPALSPAGGTN